MDEIDEYIIEIFQESLPDIDLIITNLDTNEVIYEQNESNL
jgi:hypothetical protein